MLFETDFIDLSGDLLSEMRLLVEGAINLYEDETAVLMWLAGDANEQAARSALNDIGGALYIMRRHIRRLQTEQHKAAMQGLPTRKANHMLPMTEKSRLKTGISPCFRRDFRQ